MSLHCTFNSVNSLINVWFKDKCATIYPKKKGLMRYEYVVQEPKEETNTFSDLSVGECIDLRD